MAPNITHQYLFALFFITLALSPPLSAETILPIKTFSSTVAASFSTDEKTLWVFSRNDVGVLTQKTLDITSDTNVFRASYAGLGYPALHAFSRDGTQAAFIFKNKHAPGTLEPTYYHVAIFKKGMNEIFIQTKAQTESFTALAFSNDGKRLAVLGLSDGEIIDLTTKRAIPLKQLSPASHVAFTNDGRFLVAQARYEQRKKGFPLNYGFVAIFDAATGAQIARFNNETNNGIVMNHDGTELLTVTKDYRAILRTIETGAVKKTFEGHLNRVKSAQFSPDGQHILTDSVDRTARIWDIQTEQTATTLCGTNQNPLSTAQFSNDGNHVVVRMDNNLAKVWNIKKDHYVASMKGVSSQVTSVVQSPDDKTVGIISSLDFVPQAGPMLLYELTTGQMRYALGANLPLATSVMMSPQGHYVLTTDLKAYGYLWQL